MLPYLFFNPWGDWPFVTLWPKTPFQSSIKAEFFLGDLEPEAEERVFALLLNRVQSQRRFIVSSVRDWRDDQPSISLQVGLSRSLAVCRIGRYFSHNDFKVFIELLQKKFEKEFASRPEVAESFDSISKLKEIFLIPSEIADQIFKDIKNPLETLKEELPRKPSEAERSKFSLDCSVLLLGALKGLTEKQLAQLNPIPVGTGFLVGATHLLTNYHVLFDEAVAKQCIAQFNYEGAVDNSQKVVKYEFDPDALFIQEPNLDYALIQLKFDKLTRQAGHNFGWLQLVEDDANIIPDLSEEKHIIEQLEEVADYVLSKEEKNGDNVILIHHPKGRQKKVDLTNNRVISGGLYKRFLRYQGESDYGSSGCPVFNTKWELVALNHAAIPKDGAYVKQGIRICQVVEDLKRKAATSQKLRNFIEDFVITSEQLDYPPLPTTIELNGINSYILTDSSVAFASANFEADVVSVRAFGGVELKTFNGLPKIRHIEFSPDGQVLAIANDRHIRIVRPDGTELATFEHGHGTLIRCLKFSPDKEKEQLSFSTCGGREIKLWKWGKASPTPQEQSFQPIAVNNRLQAPWDLSFSADGQTIYCISLDGMIGAWRINSNQFETKRLEGANGILSHTATVLSSDGQKLASVLKDNTLIQIWTIDGALSQSLQANSAVVRLSFDPTNEILAAALGNTGEVQLWRLSGGEFKPWIMDLKHEGVTRVSFSPDGKILVSATASSIDPTARSGIVKFWRLSDGSLLAPLKNAGSITAFNPTTTKYFADNSTVDGLNEFTIEAWINPNPNSSEGTIVGNFLASARAESQGIYRFYVSKPKDAEIQGQVLFQLALAEDRNLKDYSVRTEVAAPLTFGEFSHVAVTLKGQILRLYVNGQKFDELEAGFKALSQFGRGDTPEIIGARIYDAVENGQEVSDGRKLSRFFQGAISEVRFWSEARNQSQLKVTMYRRLWEDELKSPALVGYWRFEEGRNDKVYNLADTPAAKIAYSRNFSFAPNIKWLNTFLLDTLPFPCGLTFNTRENYIDCSATESLNTPDRITIEAWIKHQYGNYSIMSRLDEVKGGYALGFHDNKLRAVFCNQNSEHRTVVETRYQIANDNVWHHVACTWENLEKESIEQGISIYVDGKLQDTIVLRGNYESISFEGQHRTIGLFEGNLEGLTTNFKIGGSEALFETPIENDQKSYFNVSIAQVRVWKMALTQTQIRAFMNQRVEYDRLARETGDDIESSKDLVAVWRLDQQGLQTGKIQDLVGSNHSQLIGHLTSFPRTLNQPNAITLKDIDGHWAEAFITVVVNQNLMFDFPESSGLIHPDQPITRAEFVKVVVRSFRFNFIEAREQSKLTFLDLEEDNPVFFSVQRAYLMGFLPDVSDEEFYSEGRFHPGNSLSREEVIVFLIEGLKFLFDLIAQLNQKEPPSKQKFYDDSNSDQSDYLGKSYEDYLEIKETYRDAIKTATKTRMVVNYPNPKRLEPKRTATRGEFAALIYQALVASGAAPSLYSPYIVDDDPYWADLDSFMITFSE